MSAAKRSRIPGRSTLIATSRPSVVTARCTCAIDAEPMGSGSINENRFVTGSSKLRTISASISRNGTGGKLSCNESRLCVATSPTRSGRVASDWPSLMAAGPMSWNAAA